MNADLAAERAKVAFDQKEAFTILWSAEERAQLDLLRDFFKRPDMQVAKDFHEKTREEQMEEAWRIVHLMASDPHMNDTFFKGASRDPKRRLKWPFVLPFPVPLMTNLTMFAWSIV